MSLRHSRSPTASLHRAMRSIRLIAVLQQPPYPAATGSGRCRSAREVNVDLTPRCSAVAARQGRPPPPRSIGFADYASRRVIPRPPSIPAFSCPRFCCQTFFGRAPGSPISAVVDSRTAHDMLQRTNSNPHRSSPRWPVAHQSAPRSREVPTLPADVRLSVSIRSPPRCKHRRPAAPAGHVIRSPFTLLRQIAETPVARVRLNRQR